MIYFIYEGLGMFRFVSYYLMIVARRKFDGFANIFSIYDQLNRENLESGLVEAM
jgi:hypothetical protein